MTQDLELLTSKLGLDGKQRSKLLNISAPMLSAVEHDRRFLNALSLGYLEQAVRIMITLPNPSQAFQKPSMAAIEKELKRLSLALEKQQNQYNKRMLERQQAENKKHFAQKLLTEAELGPRPHHGFCRQLEAEAQAEIGILSPFLFAKLKARIVAIEAEIAFWNGLKGI